MRWRWMACATARTAPFCVDDTVRIMQQLMPERGYITHVGHEVEYNSLCHYLPEFMEPAYDGMELRLG